MSKIFEFNPGQKGTLIEGIKKGVGVNVNNSFAKTEKGIAYRALQSNAGEITYSNADASALNFGTTPFSLVFAFKMGKFVNVGSSLNTIFSNSQNPGGSNATGIDLNYTSTEIPSIKWGDSAGNTSSIALSSSALNVGRWYLGILTFDGTTYRAYLNNNLVGPNTTIRDISSSFDFWIGRDGYLQRRCNSDILYIKAYNHTFSEQERNREYKEFLQSMPVEKPVRGFELVKPNDLSYLKDDKVGVNLTDNYDFNSWTSTGSTFVSKTSNSFTSSAAGAGVSKPDLLVIGKKYRLTIRGNTTSSVSVTNLSVSPTYASYPVGNFNDTFDFVAETSASIYLRNLGDGTTTITHLSFQEVTGLVAAYNMRKNGNTLVDISGNHNNGTLVGEIHNTKDGLMSKGQTYENHVSLSTTITKTIWSISFKADKYTMTNFDYIFGGLATKNILLSRTDRLCFRDTNQNYNLWDGTGNTSIVTSQELENKPFSLTFSCDGTNIYAYLNGVDKGYVTPANTEIEISQFFNGYPDNDRGTKIELQDLRIYNRVLTDQEIKDYHNSFVNPYLLEDFDYPVGMKNLPYWIQESGAFEIKESLEGKYLECTTNGKIKINYNITTDVDASFDYYDGANWTTYSDKLSDLITALAGLSVENNYLVFNLTSGEAIANIKILDGVRV